MKKLITILALLASASAFADPTPASITYQSPLGDMQRNLNIGSIQNNEADVSVYIASPNVSDPFEIEGKAFFAVEHFGVLEKDGCRVEILLKKDSQDQYSSADVTGGEGCFLPLGLYLNGTYNIRK
jgi:hypothetical protein